MTRLCLIGLPRCGSQYISSLICSNSKIKIKNIDEPFTPRHESSLSLIGIDFTKVKTYEDQVAKVLEYISSLGPDQPLILKLFLYAWVPFENHIQIVDALRKLGFDFAIIKRKNTLEQLLSLGIGLTVNKFNNFADYDNSLVTIDSKTMNVMRELQANIAMFDQMLVNLELDKYPVLHYETIKLDLTVFLRHAVYTTITPYKKMSTIPSKDRVLNIDEVLKFLNINDEKDSI